MTHFPGSTTAPICPVCSGRGQPLLALPAQPIYQHPVPADVVVPLPHLADLSWDSCTDCSHGWQPDFDEVLLERIYRSHYYTPAPGGIALQFRNDFLAALERFELLKARRGLLEIGSSDGDVLAELRGRTGALHAYAFEPNQENAAVARQRGLDVRERFFGADVSGEGLSSVDLIYARHVIEHIFRFDDFFTGLDVVAARDADLVLETPSLDHHAEAGSVAPFHIEHVHVFSLRSLTRMAHRHGWGLMRGEVTADGNLIAWYKKGQPAVEVSPPVLDGLQQSVTSRRAYWRKLVEGRPLIFWGAGSTGVALANIIGREPEFWTDGNPNKVGKRFVGLKSDIVSPELAFSQIRSRDARSPVLVIASSFAREILPRVRQLGWENEIFDMAGNGL